MSTTEQTVTSPLDKVIADISTAMHEWSIEQAKTITDKVHRRLDQHRDEVLMKLMGFDKSYGGGWAIDHCNGRNGNSVISDFLKDSQREAVQEWLSQITLPTMTPAFKAKIQKELQRTYENEVSSHTYSMAKAKAHKDINDFMATVFPATLVEKHLQMQALLTPTTSAN